MQLAHLNKYFYKYRFKLLLGVLITIGARIFALIMPEYVQNAMQIIENQIKTGNQENIQFILLQYVFIIIISALLSGILTFLMRQLIINVSRHIEFDIKNEIYKKYQTLDQSFYKAHRTGDLMNRISEDVSRVRMYAGPAIMYSVQTITLFLCIIPLMFYTSITLTIYTLLPLPFLAIFIYFLSKKIHYKTGVVQKFLSDLSVFSQETFSGISVIKSYAIEPQIINSLQEITHQGKQKNLDLARVQAWFLPSMSFLIGLSIVFVLFIGGNLYINGDIDSVGVIAKFSIYVLMLTWPVSSIGWVSSIVQQAEASQQRINDFLNTKSKITSVQNPLEYTDGDIVFDKVNFTYAETKIQALKEVSFRIKQGQFVVIIGRTGSGKSTLIDLLTRMYQPDEGSITIDGKNINKIDLQELRKQISVILQDDNLFNDTIKNNIKMANPQASDSEIEQVAKLSQIHHNILNFNRKYDTIIGEDGVLLSGGQRQRILIARTLIKSAQIYIFDDALSAVDTQTERKILQNLRKIHKGKTKIMVSHRVSVARNADYILVIDEGRIVEQGTQDELYKKNGLYRTFYNIQNNNQ